MFPCQNLSLMRARNFPENFGIGEMNWNLQIWDMLFMIRNGKGKHF